MKVILAFLISILPLQPILAMQLRNGYLPLSREEIFTFHHMPYELMQHMVLLQSDPTIRAHLFSTLSQVSKGLKTAMFKQNLEIINRIYIEYFYKHKNKNISTKCPLLRAIEVNNRSLIESLVSGEEKFICKKPNCGVFILKEAKKKGYKANLYEKLRNCFHVKNTSINLRELALYNKPVLLDIVSKENFITDIEKGKETLKIVPRSRLFFPICDLLFFPARLVPAIWFVSDLLKDTKSCSFYSSEENILQICIPSLLIVPKIVDLCVSSKAGINYNSRTVKWNELFLIYQKNVKKYTYLLLMRIFSLLSLITSGSLTYYLIERKKSIFPRFKKCLSDHGDSDLNLDEDDTLGWLSFIIIVLFFCNAVCHTISTALEINRAKKS